MDNLYYDFLLSGGVDLAIVAHNLLPFWCKQMGYDSPINTYTVGMENIPDSMASKVVPEALGGSRYINHKVQSFIPQRGFRFDTQDHLPHGDLRG